MRMEPVAGSGYPLAGSAGPTDQSILIDARCEFSDAVLLSPVDREVGLPRLNDIAD